MDQGRIGVSSRPAGMRTRLDEAFSGEARAGLKIATLAQLLALGIIAFWLLVWVPPPRVWFTEATLLAFVVVCLLHFRLASRSRTRPWVSYAVITAYFVLLGFAMFGYDLFFDDSLPPQMMLRNGTFVYFFLFLTLVSLSLSPGLLLFAGGIGALVWSVFVVRLLRLPETVTYEALDVLGPDDPEAFLALFLDRHFVDTEVWTQDVIVLLIVAAILAAGAARARRLVVRAATSERARANLARYFSPRMVDALAEADEPFAMVRKQPVAVLFADIVGFTHLAEHEVPERVIALLRSVHIELEAAVFEHDGSLDKYLGDGIMATFGTPYAGPRDAANGLRAARTMLRRIDRLNAGRADRGEPPVRFSIGVHYGPVVLGDIGSERRLEFAVIGDVVNVASRLEHLTRSLDTRLVVSEDLLAAARAGDPDDTPRKSLVPAPSQMLRGRDTPVAILRLEEDGATQPGRRWGAGCPASMAASPQPTRPE